MESSASRSSSGHSIRDTPDDESPLALLRAEDERINPAIVLADRLMRRDAGKLLTVEEMREAETILAEGTQEIEAIESHRRSFLKTPPSAVDFVPVGF